MVSISRMVDVSRSIANPDLGAPVDPSPEDERELVGSIMEDFRAALGELRCVASERFAKQGVSMTHLHVASTLEHHGSLSMSRMADLLGVSLSNATGLIDRMEERGYVERVRDLDDRRVVFVQLTGGGTELLTSAQLIKQELVQKILDRLDGPQLTCVQRALASLRTAALDVAADPDVAAQWHSHNH